MGVLTAALKANPRLILPLGELNAAQVNDLHVAPT